LCKPMAKSEDEGGLGHFWRSSEFWPGAPLPVGDKRPETGTIRGIGWQKSEHPPGFWGMGRASEMQKGGPFWPFGALQRAFEGQKREELGHFWQFGGEGVTMKRIPFGGLT
jgi:hypothetical protein